MESHNRLLDRMVCLSQLLIMCVLLTLLKICILILYYYLIMLLNQGNDMDASRGIMSGTMARFKMVSKLVLQHFHLLSPLFSFVTTLSDKLSF